MGLGNRNRLVITGSRLTIELSASHDECYGEPGLDTAKMRKEFETRKVDRALLLTWI